MKFDLRKGKNLSGKQPWERIKKEGNILGRNDRFFGDLSIELLDMMGHL